MVVAARLSRIPAALTEADAHLGLANRLAAPFASKLFLAYDIEGRTGSKVEVVGRPIPTAHLGASRVDARAHFGIGPDEPVVAVFGALAGATSLNERRLARGATRGRQCSTSPASGTIRRSPRGCTGLVISYAADGPVRRRPLRGRRGGLTRRRDGLGARCRRAAVDPRPLPVRDRRSPDPQRAAFRARGGAVVVANDAIGSVPGLVESLLADSTRLADMRSAMLSMARVDAAERIADGVSPLPAVEINFFLIHPILLVWRPV